MTKPRVLLDVDGVLADFVSAFLLIVKRETGIEATPDQVTRFDICGSLGLTPEQASQVKNCVGSWPRLARDIEPYPEARDGYAALSELADIYIVTSPWNSNETWTFDREGWLRRHFGIPHSRVIHTSAKFICRGDFLIDDKVDAVQRWQVEHPYSIGVVWNTPHNQLDSYDGLRTRDWGWLAEIVSRWDRGAREAMEGR